MNAPDYPGHFGDDVILDQDDRSWRPLGYFNILRFTLATLFVILYLVGKLPIPLGSSDPALFFRVSFAYLIFSLLFQFTITRRKPSFATQRNINVVVDIVMVTLLMHASGGVTSGVGMLLVISIANHSMIAMGRGPALYAAIATLAILGEQGYSLLMAPQIEFNFPFAGLLGGTLFATAILTNILARRALESEALAKQRGIDLANMAQLTEYVIQQMQVGVVVIDTEEKVRLLNTAAWQLLGSPDAPLHADVERLSPPLLTALRRWKSNPQELQEPLHLPDGGAELLPHFVPVGSSEEQGTLIFLEDASHASNQAQQLKLAALGRLTASIAHEVRNPLGAISHANDLLAESPHLDNHDVRLTQIVKEQSRRINTMVENILQLGRQRSGKIERLDLAAWLERFVDTLLQLTKAEREDVAIELREEGLNISFDSDQLLQIALNLSQNALRHTADLPAEIKPRLYLVAGRERDRTYLDFIDRGPGVPEEHQSQLFEPFYTTESSGSGLGLYISRELAANNSAQLSYQPTDDAMSRFRLTFARDGK